MTFLALPRPRCEAGGRGLFARESVGSALRHTHAKLVRKVLLRAGVLQNLNHFFALVRQNCFPMSHKRKTGSKGFAPSWGFTESQPISPHSCDRIASPLSHVCAETAASGSRGLGSCAEGGLKARTRGSASRRGGRRPPGTFPERRARGHCVPNGNHAGPSTPRICVRGKRVAICWTLTRRLHN